MLVHARCASSPALLFTLAVAVAVSPVIAHAGAPVPAPMLTEPAAEGEPAEPAPLRASVRIDASKLGSEGEPIANRLDQQARAVLTEQGFVDPLDDLDPVIVVIVEKAPDKSNPGYVIGLSVERGDEVLPGSARQYDCSLCTNTELIDRVGEQLPPLLKIARENQPTREVAGGDGDGPDDGPDGPEGPGEAEPIKPIGPLGYAGIGLGVVGLGGVGAGVGLAIKGFEPIPEEPGMRRNYRTPGNVILAVGGAALIAGVVMIAVDVSKRKKARAKQAEAEPKKTVRWTGLGLEF